MIPRTIVAHPDDLADPGAHAPGSPDIIPLPGSRRPERDMPSAHGAIAHPRSPAPSEVGARDIINALRYHSVLFVTLGGLVAAGLFTAVWILVPAKYTTYATLFVDQRIPSTMPTGAGNDESGNFATVLKTQASFIKSRKTIGGALLDPKYGIAQMPMLRNEEDPADYLEQKILIDLTDTSNSALRVALSGDDPKQITAIVNAVVDYFLQEVKALGAERTRRIARLEKIRNELQQLSAAKLKHFEEVFVNGDQGEAKTVQQKMRVSQYVELLRDQAKTHSDLAALRGMLKTAQAKVEENDAKPPQPPADDLTQWIDRDGEVMAKGMAIKKLLRDMKAIEDQSANPYTPKYFEMQRRANAEAAELEVVKQKVRNRFETVYRAGERQKLIALAEQAQEKVKLVEAQEQSITGQLGEFKEFKELDEAGKKQLAARTAEDDAIQRYRAQISQLDMTITHLTADLDAPDRVQLWQPALEPTKKDIRKQAAVSGAAGLAGLGLVGGLISLYEIRRKRVYGPADLLFRQKLPLIGCLPECAAPASTKADAIDPAGRPFFEAMDKIKAVICRQMMRRKMQTVLITSAVPGEGKSAVAWHLALSLARSDRRTLFIDGNLRNPGLHNHFEIASHPGLSELVRGERTMQEVVQRTALDNLWCIAAGVCCENGRQALDKDGLRQILDRACRDFDYIVIDTCSIREAVDPLYLAQRADATILAVRSYHSGTADVERACERLTQIGTPLLGAVLTDPSGAGCEL